MPAAKITIFISSTWLLTMKRLLDHLKATKMEEIANSSFVCHSATMTTT